MSHGGYDRRRQGHGRGRDDRRGPPPVSEEQRLRNLIIRLADNEKFQPDFDIPNIVEDHLRPKLASHSTVLAEAFRISILEQPYKIPYTAALFASLLQRSSRPSDEDPTEYPEGKTLFQDFCKRFQSMLDRLAWRELRLTVIFFAHLAVSKTVSASSFLELLQSFLVVLDEPGVSYERMEAAALCIGEGLIRAGTILFEYDAQQVEVIVSTMRSCLQYTQTQRSLSRPISILHSGVLESSTELLESLVTILDGLLAESFKAPLDILPRPHDSLPLTSLSFDIPSSMVPPEDFDFGGLVEDSPARRIMLPKVALRFFDDELTPSPTTPHGFILRTSIRDAIDIFEVNRKDCATIIIGFARWFTEGTFKGKAGLGPPLEEPLEHDFALEMTLLEVVLSELVILPFSTQLPVYYPALIVELCKISPETVGPAVGKSIRKFYSFIGEGLDVEVTERLTDWFVAHMSNFGFNWVWKEWIPDLERPAYHPKRIFINRTLELEIRLAYHDRILKTLPDPFLDPDMECVPTQAPGPEFQYEDQQHPYFEAVQPLLSLVKSRGAVTDAITASQALEAAVSEIPNPEAGSTPESAVRSITMQILLSVGSRSISHFLNAIERYLPLLRELGKTQDAKIDYLNASAKFWRRNRQMVSIVFDKLMQYQIVDPSDIIGWIFRGGRQDVDGNEVAAASGLANIGTRDWDLLKAALDKAIGRVAIARQKVLTLRKEEEDAQAKVTASMELEGENAQAKAAEQRHKDVSEQLSNAEKASSVLAKEQRVALAKSLEGFVKALTDKAVSPATLEVLTSEGWEKRDDWSREQWEYWQTWGWFRQFARFYARQLKSNQITFEAGPLAGLSAIVDDKAPGKLLFTTWSLAIGRL